VPGRVYSDRSGTISSSNTNSVNIRPQRRSETVCRRTIINSATAGIVSRGSRRQLSAGHCSTEVIVVERIVVAGFATEKPRGHPSLRNRGSILSRDILAASTLRLVLKTTQETSFSFPDNTLHMIASIGGFDFHFLTCFLVIIRGSELTSVAYWRVGKTCILVPESIFGSQTHDTSSTT